MKLLFCGDVVGRSGREAVFKYVPYLRKELSLDAVIVNGENACHGFGITGKICQEFYDHGVDVITTGNHAWDQKEIIPYIEKDPRLLRPLNYPKSAPGKGIVSYPLRDGRSLVVMNVMGRLFMDPLDDPFAAVEEVLKTYRLTYNAAAIVIDIHAEATSEKGAMGWFADGRVSLVVGTHSHVPTADARILSQGTAYQTDAGMCGDYTSVIGMKKEVPIAKFVKKITSERMSPAEGEGTLCGVFVEVDDKTGLAKRIHSIRLGGSLPSTDVSLSR
jgi:metallophosphoesterase (TIGR00282 family)